MPSPTSARIVRHRRVLKAYRRVLRDHIGALGAPAYGTYYWGKQETLKDALRWLKEIEAREATR